MHSSNLSLETSPGDCFTETSCFKLSFTAAPQLCHGVVDALCGRQPPRRSDYSAAAAAASSPEEWLQLLDSLTALFRLAVGNNSSDQEVKGFINPSINQSVCSSVLYKP